MISFTNGQPRRRGAVKKTNRVCEESKQGEPTSPRSVVRYFREGLSNTETLEFEWARNSVGGPVGEFAKLNGWRRPAWTECGEQGNRK